MFSMKIVCLLLFFCIMSLAKETWLRPGCHKVGNTRKISIPDCVEFHITTNACRGFCESYAVPSMPWGAVGGLFKPPKPVVSVGQCCNMMESEEIQKRVLCMGGMRNFTFQSAVSCSCYHCKKD
ncbi:hypothetical protein DOY81_003991 [Sarcophaga bullata]|nr:hypothetical protein DOY81_003991 [Sarcophaga bullata]